MPHTHTRAECVCPYVSVCVCIFWAFATWRISASENERRQALGGEVVWGRWMAKKEICRGNCILVHQLYGNKNNNPFLFYCVREVYPRGHYSRHIAIIILFHCCSTHTLCGNGNAVEDRFNARESENESENESKSEKEKLLWNAERK